MARPAEKLAESLESLRILQDRGLTAIRSRDLSRTHRERLLGNGFLVEVMKGWYIPAVPALATAGESTIWYASFWNFCATYLAARFGSAWCLSPEQSLALHTGNHTVPPQLLVRSPKGRNRVTNLPHGTSLFDLRAALPKAEERAEKDGLRLFSLPAALVRYSPRFFMQNQLDARTALAMVRDASEVLGLLLEGGNSVVAGRLAGAFRNIGRSRIADDIMTAMHAAGYEVREHDPFTTTTARDLLAGREISPCAGRIRLLWSQFREGVMENFPRPPGKVNDDKAYMSAMEDIYLTDAYNSLSIEGYQASPDLIERIRHGNWRPDTSSDDRRQADAFAAHGYWLAYLAVRTSVLRILTGENPGIVAAQDHGGWYRQMFSPSVQAGLIPAAELSGYRRGQVFIRGSMHIPPRHEAVADAMDTLFALLEAEPDPGVRVVLGHFVFVHIHPYMDGNGRMARFLMNVMLAAGGYPWTVIPVDQRDAYLDTLEEASARQRIIPFAKFLGGLVGEGLG